VDFIEYHCGNSGEYLPRVPRRQKEIQALRGGDKDLRRVTEHSLTLGAHRVPTARLHSYLRKGTTAFFEDLSQLLERGQQIALNVVVKSLEGRDVKDPDPAALPDSREETVDRPKKGCQRFAASRGSRYQCVFAIRDDRPCLALYVRGVTVTVHKPLLNERVKQRKRRGDR
jgi:hypothetical protein